jgi:hypothetical protein
MRPIVLAALLCVGAGAQAQPAGEEEERRRLQEERRRMAEEREKWQRAEEARHQANEERKRLSCRYLQQKLDAIGVSRKSLEARAERDRAIEERMRAEGCPLPQR